MATDFLEKQVEALICAELQTALAAVVTRPGVPIVVTGFLQPSAAGTARESAQSGVLVTVRPHTGVFGLKNVTLSVTADVKIDVSDSASGDLLPEAAAPVMNTLAGWHASAETLRTALNVANVFRADGCVNADGGDAGFDPVLAVWYWTVFFQIKGCIL